MLATPGALPLGAGEWAYEMKWDGIRALAECAAGRTRLVSRNEIDITVSYPELHELAAALGRDALLDGEIVAFDRQGRPNFALLQRRMHVVTKADTMRRARHTPVVFLVFDLLALDGHSLVRRPYQERRELLESIDLGIGPWQVPPAFEGDARDAIAASAEHGLEGIVAKRMGSPYRPGRRSPDWIKIKHVRTQDVLVGGWRPGAGRRASGIGSLLLGVPAPDGLHYAGRVGTGFTDRMLAELGGRLTRLEQGTCPFRDQLPASEHRHAHWVQPTLVGEVAFTEWTDEHRLRHPVWRGLRPDKKPDDVTFES